MIRQVAPSRRSVEDQVTMSLAWIRFALPLRGLPAARRRNPSRSTPNQREGFPSPLFRLLRTSISTVSPVSLLSRRCSILQLPRPPPPCPLRGVSLPGARLRHARVTLAGVLPRLRHARVTLAGAMPPRTHRDHPRLTLAGAMPPRTVTWGARLPLAGAMPPRTRTCEQRGTSAGATPPWAWTKTLVYLPAW